MKRLLIAVALFLCGYTVSGFALFAFKKTYDVEVIVFSTISKQALLQERWPLINPEIDIPAHQSPWVKSIPTRWLKKEDASLMRDSHYKILLHTAWQATWAGEGSTIDIPLRVGEMTDGQPELNGLITIHLAQYFDTHVNLMLTKPMAELGKIGDDYFSAMKTPYFTFQLKQAQRMRSDELNYIGNPLMGVLIKIMPVK